MVSDTPSALTLIVRREANEWFVLNRGGDLSQQQIQAFREWLHLCPQCIEEYLRVAAISNQLHEAVQGVAEDIAALLIEAQRSPGGAVLPLFGPSPHAAPNSAHTPAKDSPEKK